MISPGATIFSTLTANGRQWQLMPGIIRFVILQLPGQKSLQSSAKSSDTLLICKRAEGRKKMIDSWLQLITTLVTGWVAWELRQLRKDVAHRVPFSECNRRIEKNDKRIEYIEKQIDENVKAVENIKGSLGL